MADYREISQEYAKGAINSLFLLNGGGILAVGSQAEHLGTIGLADDVGTIGLWWISGLVIGGVVWITGFLAARYFDKHEREPPPHNHKTTSNRYMTAAALLTLVSLGLFAGGAYWLVTGLEFTDAAVIEDADAGVSSAE